MKEGRYIDTCFEGGGICEMTDAMGLKWMIESRGCGDVSTEVLT